METPSGLLLAVIHVFMVAFQLRGADIIAIPARNYTVKFDMVYKTEYVELNLNGVKIKNGRAGV